MHKLIKSVISDNTAATLIFGGNQVVVDASVSNLGRIRVYLKGSSALPRTRFFNVNDIDKILDVIEQSY